MQKIEGQNPITLTSLNSSEPMAAAFKTNTENKEINLTDTSSNLEELKAETQETAENLASAETVDFDNSPKDTAPTNSETIALAKKEAQAQSDSPIQEFFKNGPQWFQHFRNYFVLSLNAVGIALNTSSAIANHSDFLPKPVAEYLDKASEWYSRYVVSLGFGWNGVESLVGKRPIEALTRFLPTLGFFTLPFYNFNLATGVSSGLSYILGMLVKRNGDKQPGQGSAIKNTTELAKHFKDMLLDTFNSKSNESWLDKFAMFGLMAGSIGGLTFAANDRDNFWARLFGNLRNLGGLAGDYELVFNDDKTWRGNHKRLVGFTCSLASVLNIIARWVDPKLGRTLNHISIAADDFGLTYWAQMSKKDNDEASGKIPSIEGKKEENNNKEAVTAVDLHQAERAKPVLERTQQEAANFTQAV